jgi:LacI family transcriptional regulator
MTTLPAGAVNLRDVAAAAGVSVASASVALNGRDGVAATTRARIVEAAQRLGYRANPQAQALRRGLASSYGLIVRNLANPFFLDVVSGAEEVAAQAGVTLVLANSRYSPDLEREHVRSLAAHRCAGLAIAPVGNGESFQLWAELTRGTTAVALNATLAPGPGAPDPLVPDVPRVGPDNLAAVDLPLARLAELGHERVAFLCAPRTLMADPDRLARFRRTSRQLGLRGSVLTAALTLEAVRTATSRALSGPNPPTAIMTNSDYTAQAIYQSARDLSLRIGVDVSVVGHDDLPTSELLDPPMATLRVDRRALGRAVMERLLDPELRTDHVEPVTMVERASLAPPVHAAATPSPHPRHRRSRR